ncbi:hypothetical protein AMTRI_Chr01g103060 [Amborella trichopoda]
MEELGTRLMDSLAASKPPNSTPENQMPQQTFPENEITAKSSLGNSFNVQSHLKSVALAAISVLLERETEEVALSNPMFDAIDKIFIERVYPLLISLFLEASRRDSSSFLRTECSLSEQVAEILIHVFEENRAHLRRILSKMADHGSIPRVSGVDWRINHCNPNELSYFINLETINGENGQRGKLGFVCNVEELQNLVASIKEACTSAERLANGANPS